MAAVSTIGGASAAADAVASPQPMDGKCGMLLEAERRGSAENEEKVDGAHARVSGEVAADLLLIMPRPLLLPAAADVRLLLCLVCTRPVRRWRWAGGPPAAPSALAGAVVPLTPSGGEVRRLAVDEPPIVLSSARARINDMLSMPPMAGAAPTSAPALIGTAAAAGRSTGLALGVAVDDDGLPPPA